MHAAQGRVLRYGPGHGTASGSHGQVFASPPEVAGGVVIFEYPFGMHVARDDDVVRHLSQADDLCVKAEINVKVGVMSRLEEEGVSARAKFAVLLLGKHFVQGALN